MVLRLRRNGKITKRIPRERSFVRWKVQSTTEETGGQEDALVRGTERRGLMLLYQVRRRGTFRPMTTVWRRRRMRRKL